MIIPIHRKLYNEFGKITNLHLSTSREKSVFKGIDDFIKTVYTELNHANSTTKAYTPDLQEITSDAELPRPDILEPLRKKERHADAFMPYEIYHYINQNALGWIRFKHTIDLDPHTSPREIYIHFIVFERISPSLISQYQSYYRKIVVWLNCLSALSSAKCSKVLNVYIYMTPHTKILPINGMDPVISAFNANTGLTKGCMNHGEIVIYRKEEWFKVFIHETMHNFGMDFLHLDLKQINVAFKQMFSITQEVLFFETYTETWARIMNICISAYYISGLKTFNEFMVAVKEGIEIERLFSVYQCVKVLGYMDLSYDEVSVPTPGHRKVCRELYRENTNVFAYYILGAVMMANVEDFILWCTYNNRPHAAASSHTHDTLSPRFLPIRFNDTEKNIERFISFLGSIYRTPYTLSLIKQAEEKLQKQMKSGHETILHTMRMTLVLEDV